MCLRRGLAIVADEIHCELTLGSHRHTPIASLDPEIADRTITLMAPSKTFNLAGLKVLVAVIPNATLARSSSPAHRPGANRERVRLHRGLRRLPRRPALARRAPAHLEANRGLRHRVRATCLPGVAMSPPEATYLAWLDFRNADGASRDPFTFFLERARVALNDGALFGPGGAGFVRLNFGCPRTMLAQALDRMRRPSRAPEQRASELIEVVVVVPGHHRQKLVDRPPASRIGVDPGARPGVGRERRKNSRVSRRRRVNAASATAASLSGTGARRPSGRDWSRRTGAGPSPRSVVSARGTTLRCRADDR